MKRILWGMFIIVLVISFGILGCARKEKVIEIGSILPLTGNNAVDGEAAKQAIDLAIEEKSNKLIEKGLSIKVIYEDDKMEPREGVNAANCKDSDGI